MAGTQSYDYSLTVDHIEPFQYADLDTAFLEEDADSYDDLWQFKPHIIQYTFGIAKQKGYVFLRYKIDYIPQFYTWNIKEKVENIEDHCEHFIVIVLRAVDDSGNATSHNHSIVIEMRQEHGKFDVVTLMAALQGTDMESLNDDFISKQLLPWQEGTACSVVKRLRGVRQTLDKYAIVTAAKAVSAKKGIKRQPVGAERGETMPKRGRGRSHPGSSRAEAQKRNPAQSRDSGEGTRKRSKPSGPKRTAEGEGAASGVTTVQTGTSRSVPPAEDFEKFAFIQREFWQNHKACFLFETEATRVHINQCIIARDDFIIRTLQRSLVEDMKNTLVQIGDVKQLQKVCLTPVDENNALLKQPPTSWDAIKGGKFMIINGQHSITASQELQAGGCGEPRRSELQMWDAYIVWTLDEAKLRIISNFYNCTNHLNHAKPTWGNQMISCRKTWKICGRPTEKENEGVVRRNRAIFNVPMHKVRSSIQTGIVASTIPGLLSYLKILFLCVPCSTSQLSFNACMKL